MSIAVEVVVDLTDHFPLHFSTRSLKTYVPLSSNLVYTRGETMLRKERTPTCADFAARFPQSLRQKMFLGLFQVLTPQGENRFSLV